MMQQPFVIHVNMERAELAFATHTALVKMEAADPTLRDNPYWTMLRQDAWEQFWIAFDKVPG